MVLSQFWLFFEVQQTLLCESFLCLFTSCFLQTPGGGVFEIEKILNVTLIIVLEVMAVVDQGVRGFLHADIVAVVVEVVNLSLAPEVVDCVRLIGCREIFLVVTDHNVEDDIGLVFDNFKALFDS